MVTIHREIAETSCPENRRSASLSAPAKPPFPDPLSVSPGSRHRIRAVLEPSPIPFDIPPRKSPEYSPARGSATGLTPLPCKRIRPSWLTGFLQFPTSQPPPAAPKTQIKPNQAKPPLTSMSHPYPGPGSPFVLSALSVPLSPHPVSPKNHTGSHRIKLTSAILI